MLSAIPTVFYMLLLSSGTADSVVGAVSYGEIPDLRPVEALVPSLSGKKRLALKRELHTRNAGVELRSGWVFNPRRKIAALASRDVAVHLRPTFDWQTFSDTGLARIYRLNARGELEHRYLQDTSGQRERPLSNTLGRLHFGGSLRVYDTYQAGFSLNLSRSLDDLAEEPDVAIFERTPRTRIAPRTSLGVLLLNKKLRLNGLYTFVWNDYDNRRLWPFSSLQHKPGLQVRWTPMENLELMLTSEAILTRYRLGRGNSRTKAAHGDTNILRNTLQLNTQLSSHAYFSAQLGVADGFARNVRQEHIPIGSATLNYRAASFLSARLSARRQLQPSSMFSLVTATSIEAALITRFTARTQAQIRSVFSHYSFGGAEKLSKQRRDAETRIEIELSHQFEEHYRVALIERLENRTSNFADDNANYRRNDVYLQFGLLL